jgi:hypothetical protein
MAFDRKAYSKAYNRKRWEEGSTFYQKPENKDKVVNTRRKRSKSEVACKTELLTRSYYRARVINKEYNLDKEWYLAQLDIQDQKCFYTKVPLEFKRNHPYSATLDRIDSSKGYTKDNCVVVTKFINLAKSDHSLEEFKVMLEVAAKAFRDDIKE